MFDNFNFTELTLEENIKLLIRLINDKDKIILDDYKYGKTKETENIKNEITVFISSLKTYIHSQVDDI